MFTCKELLDAKELFDKITHKATDLVKTQKSAEMIEERTFAEKYQDMSYKWLRKRRHFLCTSAFTHRYGYKPGNGTTPAKRINALADRVDLFQTWTDKKIEAVLIECEAIEDILEDREDKRLDYAASAQEYGG